MNIFSILIPKHTLTYLNANDPLDQAVAFLLGATYTAIPVVDDQGRYVGIASEGDFLRAVMEHGRENLAKYKVEVSTVPHGNMHRSYLHFPEASDL